MFYIKSLYLNKKIGNNFNGFYAGCRAFGGWNTGIQGLQTQREDAASGCGRKIWKGIHILHYFRF